MMAGTDGLVLAFCCRSKETENCLDRLETFRDADPFVHNWIATFRYPLTDNHQLDSTTH